MCVYERHMRAFSTRVRRKSERERERKKGEIHTRPGVRGAVYRIKREIHYEYIIINGSFSPEPRLYRGVVLYKECF